MTVTSGDTASQATATPTSTPTTGGPAARALAVLRIAFGLTFLWAFVDKLLALGLSTGYAAWINGASPTEGFLKFGADGPFQGFYNSIAGAALVDWLFMLGLLGIGLALTLGIATRLACAAGAILYLMMWTVVLPPENNPVLDDHILGAISLVVLALLNAGDTWGLGKRLAGTRLVQAHPVLR
jgi:thiosulfate dehydrogenase [quinone] large subunit